MNAFTYNAITATLAIGVVIALVLLVVSLISMIVRWRTPNRRKHVMRLAVSAVAIPCLVGMQQAILWLVFLPSLGREQMAEVNAARQERLVETSLVRVGDPAPQFSLRDSDKVTLINFFATWCGPCQVELPHIERIWTANKKDEHFCLMVIGREETTESVREYRDKNDFTFPIAADPDRAVYSLFAKESIPRTLVVSPGGRVVYSKAGFYEDDLDELEAVLREQLASVK